MQTTRYTNTVTVRKCRAMGVNARFRLSAVFAVIAHEQSNRQTFQRELPLPFQSPRPAHTGPAEQSIEQSLFRLLHRPTVRSRSVAWNRLKSDDRYSGPICRPHPRDVSCQLSVASSSVHEARWLESRRWALHLPLGTCRCDVVLYWYDTTQHGVQDLTVTNTTVCNNMSTHHRG